MTTKAEGNARLKKLANYLEKKVKPKYFHLPEFYSDINNDYDWSGIDIDADLCKDIGCGTAACALGYCPLVFPKDWAVLAGGPRLKSSNFLSPFSCAEQYFNISMDDVWELFDKQGYNYGEPTAKQVASKIRKLIK